MKKAAINRLMKWAAFAMLAFYLFSLGGYYVVYGVMQYQAKQTMHSLITHSADYKQLGLEKIQLAKNNLEKITADEDEFTFKNKRYDVVSAAVSVDSITLYCIWDRNEESVVNALHQYQLVNGSGEQSRQQKTILNIVKLLNQPAVVENINFNVSSFSDFLIIHFQDKKDVSGIIGDIYIPPKLA